MKTFSNTCVRSCRDDQKIFEGQELIRNIESFLEDRANLFQLIANPVRMKIILLLLEEKDFCVCDLSDILEMTIPAVSQHLKKLKLGHLILARREGTTIYHFINPDKKEDLIKAFEGAYTSELSLA